MISGFSTNWPSRMEQFAGKPTYFVEKVWKSFHEEPVTAEFRDALHRGYFDMNAYEEVTAKPHTIREDSLQRWKVGMDIHYYINVRKTNMLQFAPVKKVTGIQEIEIKITSKNKDGKVSGALIYVDDEYLGGYNLYGGLPSQESLEKLALNDGFPSLEGFFQWFNKDFTGRIIHWTDLRY